MPSHASAGTFAGSHIASTATRQHAIPEPQRLGDREYPLAIREQRLRDNEATATSARREGRLEEAVIAVRHDGDVGAVDMTRLR
jgi:hypothetical protein